MVEIRLPDGSRVEGEVGKRILDCIPREAGLVARVNRRKLIDLTARIDPSFREIEILGFDAEEGKQTYWHTTSHILAHAVKELFPHFKLGVGPPIENGFYYEFDTGGRAFTPGDLERISAKMREIIEMDLPIEREEVPKEEAVAIFRKRGESLKLELLEEIEGDVVTIYRQGDFVDLCRGPHLPSTGYVKYFKLTTASAAYWRGEEGGPILQRIYGISFPTREAMEEYERMLEEARKRDHRVLGKALGLFSVEEEVGAGLVLWHPKGGLVRKIIEDFLKEVHLERGYQLVYTPHIAKGALWEISGHMKYYLENMYVFEKEGEKYVVKPMNCPFHILIYKSRTRSYRELPIRYFELGTVYRYERSGTLHGLLRVRGFTQDDAHVFLMPEQLEEEVVNILELTKYVLGAFGFTEYKVDLSTWDPERPWEYMGSEEDWERAEEALEGALRKMGMDYRVVPGEAAFYGPKIDLKLVDAIGRTWQCTTIQVDFNLPKRFNLTYVGPDGREHEVVMIHRALLGSIERFFGILIEHYAGDFPLWLAPVQVRVIPVSSRFNDYAREVRNFLKRHGIRAEVDDSQATMRYKIREAELEKIPYVVVVGKREATSRTVSVRRRGVGDMGTRGLEEFLEMLREEIRARRALVAEE